MKGGEGRKERKERVENGKCEEGEKRTVRKEGR